MAGTETRIKLTAKSIEKLAREQPSGDVWDTELGGFHVRYGKRGLTFRLYYRTKTGKRRMMTLGTYGALTLAQARRDAAEALGIVAQGGDPRAAIEAAKVESQRQQQQTLRAYLHGPYTATRSAARMVRAPCAVSRRIFLAGWQSQWAILPVQM